VAQLFPWALGSLFVASYNSHGYGGVILTRLHSKPHGATRQQAIASLVVTEESYLALFYMPLYTSFIQFAEYTNTDWK
jgi:hypothetical protein